MKNTFESNAGGRPRIALRQWGSIPVGVVVIILMRLLLPHPFVSEVMILTVYATGFSFLLGKVGFLSFGQPAYLGFGLYATAIYMFYFGHDPYVGVLVGILAGIVLSTLVGPLFIRLRSDYFALVNLALCVIEYFLLQKVLAGITQGDNGLWFLSTIASTPVLDLTNSNGFFVFSLIIVAAVWALFKYLGTTVFGASCLAAKINEDKLKFLGYSTYKIRWTSFVIANTVTALAGSMYAIYFGFVSPDLASPSRATDVVVVGLLGGVGTLFGPLVGAIVYTGLSDLVSTVITYWELVVGFLLIVVMLAGEKGLWGSVEPFLKRFLSRITGTAGTRGTAS